MLLLFLIFFLSSTTTSTSGYNFLNYQYGHTHTPFIVLDEIEREREIPDRDATLQRDVAVVEDINDKVRRHNIVV